jgi:hypothetical protein
MKALLGFSLLQGIIFSSDTLFSWAEGKNSQNIQKLHFVGL